MYYNFDAGAAIFNTVHQIPESNRLDVGVVPMPRDLGETWAKKRRVPQGKRANLPRHVRLAMSFESGAWLSVQAALFCTRSQPSIAFPFRRAGKCLLPDFHGLWAYSLQTTMAECYVDCNAAHLCYFHTQGGSIGSIWGGWNSDDGKCRRLGQILEASMVVANLVGTLRCCCQSCGGIGLAS